MSEDDSTVEERLAVRLIREFEDVAHVERLEPAGSVPTPDWRLTMADGQVADVEVTRDTDQAVQSLESQLGVAQVDESTGRSRWVAREWPDSRLCCEWRVQIFDHDPHNNKRPAKGMVEALIPVLVEAESAGGTSEQMVAAAQAKLLTPEQHLDEHDDSAARADASAREVGFEDFMLQWGKNTGYWYPPLLVDLSCGRVPRSVHVRRAAGPAVPGRGMVGTSASVPDSAWGEYEHMLATVQGHIDKKTAKRQMEQAPGLRWLFVVLDDNMAAVQLDDYFGPGCQELDPAERNPYQILDRLTFDCFDEVWITGRAFQSRDHIVLRLFNTVDAPQHKIVRCAEVLAG
ncbi:MAG: hypothetical protein F4Z34_07765 [Acidimicrobiaceae bacterium]|nr:hypothetical protein [Acidimicrobiaceae bacterium]